jgi:predicted ATPase/transcriptional regulator with XRE-family HTH domain
MTLAAQTFGEALRFLRKRSHLTQDELGRLVGYSREQIARLERGSRLPDLAVVVALFIPALDIKNQPVFAQRLLELAAQSRQQPPNTHTLTITRTIQTRTHRELEIVNEIVKQYPLPVPLLPLIGRDEELNLLIDVLLQEARLITLVGAPGIGKTRFALEASHRLSPYFKDGVCFVSLETAQRSQDVERVIFEALALSNTSLPMRQAIQSFLSSRQLLLVLDNCEHILEATPMFAEWLSAAASLKILCTSRAPLDLYGEYVWDVATLATPNLSALPSLSDLAQVASVNLFIMRARAANNSFKMQEENALSVAALCIALDGLPLAIEIAAARIRDMQVQDLLKQMLLARQHPHLSSSTLQQNKRNISERHQTLQNAIEWSVRLLSVEHKNIFISLGVMTGGCTLEAAKEVCGASQDSLQSLASTSLVNIQDGRVKLLEPIRVFAHERLCLEGCLQEIQQRHGQYFEGYAQLIFEGIRGEDQEAWLARARLDHDNFRLALQYAMDTNNSHLAVAIAGGLWWFWNRQGFAREGKKWLDESLSLEVSRELSTLQKQRRATALNGAGSICTELGDFVQAMRYHEEGLYLRRELRDVNGEAIVLHNMGLVERSRGKYLEALVLFEEALQFEAPDNISGLAMSYTNLGITAVMMYDLPLAVSWLERSLGLLRDTGFLWEIAYTCNVFATVYFEAGDLDRSEEMAKTSLELFEKFGDALFLPEPRLMLAKLAHARKDMQAARTLCMDILQQYKKMDDQYGVANVLYVLAWLDVDENPARALDLFEESRHLRNTSNHFLSPLEQVEHQRLKDALTYKNAATLGDLETD